MNRTEVKTTKEIAGEIVIFAGTTEGRRLSECLAAAGIPHTVCVATEYGEIMLNTHPEVKVHRGRMDREEIEIFLRNGQTLTVVDATHPYAKEITKNIREAVETLKQEKNDIAYWRLKRDSDRADSEYAISRFETNEACAEALKQTEGNILLTTGSKELEKYCISEELKKRLYVRVLPGMESLSHCISQGICGKQIIAMQGPFSVQMNEAMIRQYQISYLVTKESGISGGYREKLEASRETGTKVFVIGCPEEEGYSFSEITDKLEKFCKKRIPIREKLEITLAGIGMGHDKGMTKEVQEAVKGADMLFGAERMLSGLHANGEKYPFYRTEQIIPCLKKVQEENLFTEKKRAVILFSGDSGFYSGCRVLYEALKKEIREGRLNASVRIMPGISSVACLASCIGESYHDAAIYSMHGQEVCNLVRKIRRQPKIFLLTSGVRDVRDIGRLLTEAGMTECEVTVGYQLSYPDQQIRKCMPKECASLHEEGLYTCFIKNPHATGRILTHGIADVEFIRDKTPMTKEEVREVSICKLHLHDKAVVYDIGSGTGSVAVEMASLSDDIQVYAVERKKEALVLIEKNKERFRLQNITIVEKTAPEGLTDLPVATHAFIGGSGGRLKEILKELYRINPQMRIVVTAISMETICEIRETVPAYSAGEEEIVQLQANRIKQTGSYHLVQAENPVWICSFTFTEKQES